MSSFSALMALSATQTSSQQANVQKALEDRQRKEREQRKKAEEQERKQKVLDQKLILKHFENKKKEEERQKKREEEEKARDAARQRRAEEQKNALLYGPKKATSKSSGASQSREGAGAGARRKRLSDDEDDMSSAVALTREELRERKLQVALKKSMGSANRSTLTRAYHKPGARLKGGAVDLPTSQDVGSSSGMSVKERLAAMPNTLTKLNANKRDTRTIDEIVQDIAKAKELKTLDGDEAKGFNDWFGDGKKERMKSHPTSTAPTSGANTPLPSSPAPLGGTNSVKHSAAPNVKHVPSVVKTPLTKSAAAKTASRATSLEATTSKGSSKPSTALSSQRSSAPAASFKKKRPRSPSPQRYPAKRRYSPPPTSRHKRHDLSEQLDVGNMIWELMGKKRSDYVRDEIFSDEEDMEAGASDLEKEEKMSYRIAKREDQLEQEAERRHEEEKRRRKNERERY